MRTAAPHGEHAGARNPRIPKNPFPDVVDAILYLDRSGCSWRQLDRDGARTANMVIDIVRKPPEQRGFEAHRKRWVVERTPA
jgi:transposase